MRISIKNIFIIADQIIIKMSNDRNIIEHNIKYIKYVSQYVIIYTSEN